MPGLFDPDDESVIQGDGLPLDYQPQAEAPRAKSTDWGRLAPLLAALPLALKQGGRVGAAALLRGFHQEQQRGEETSRRDRLESENRQRQDASATAQREYRLAALDEQRRGKDDAAAKARSELLSKVGGDFDALTDQSALDAYLPLAVRRGAELGVPESDIRALAPTAPIMSKRAAEKKVKEALDTANKLKIPYEQALEMSVTVDGKDVPIRTLMGIASVPKAPPEAPEGTLDKQYLSASIAEFRNTNKREPTPAEMKTLITAAKKAVGQADDRPRVNVTVGGMNPREVSTFNGIVAQYDRSPLVRAADRTLVLDNAIKGIEKNPADPASQLQLAYSYVQALDTYQSAVREGELQNLGILGTRLQSFVTQLNRVAFEGAFLPPEVAKNIAANAKQLVTTIQEGQRRKQQQFGSQARVSGVGAMWDDYIKGSAAAAAPAATKTKVGRFEVEVGP